MLVRIPVWSDSGGPLTAKDLVAEADGEPARVVRLRGPSDDLFILLVVDLAEDLNEADLAKDALVQTISALPRNVYVSVLRAQDGLRVLLDPTNDRDAITQTIRAFPVSGKAGLLETVETASELADSILAKAPVRLAVLYVTDSNVYNYREDFSNPVINYSDRRDLSRRFPEGLVRERIAKLQAKLSARQAPIFVVHLEYRTDRLNEAYQNGLMELTATTGGSSAFCRSNSEIATAIQQMFRKIASHYRVDLQVAARNGADVQISLQAASGPLSYRARVHLKKR